MSGQEVGADRSGFAEFVMSSDAREEAIEDCVEWMWGPDVAAAAQVWHVARHGRGGAWRIALAAGRPSWFDGIALTLEHVEGWWPRRLLAAIEEGRFGDLARVKLGELRRIEIARLMAQANGAQDGGQAEHAITLNVSEAEAREAELTCCGANEHKAGEAKQDRERHTEEAKEATNLARGFSANDFAPVRPVTVSPRADSVLPPLSPPGPVNLRHHGPAEVERARRALCARDVLELLERGPSPRHTSKELAAAVERAGRRGVGLVDAARWRARDLRREGEDLALAGSAGAGQTMRDAGDRLEGLAHLLAGDPEVGVSLLLLSGWVPLRKAAT